MWTAHAMTRWIGTAEKCRIHRDEFDAVLDACIVALGAAACLVDDDIARHD